MYSSKYFEEFSTCMPMYIIKTVLELKMMMHIVKMSKNPSHTSISHNTALATVREVGSG